MNDDNSDMKHENKTRNINASRFFKIPAFWHMNPCGGLNT